MDSVTEKFRKLSETNIDFGNISVDSILMYLLEIRHIPLLGLEEEIILAKKIEEGKIEIKQHLVESDLKLKEIEKRNSDVKNQLIKANLRLVVLVAKRFQVKGLSLMDLIQEGNIGLMKAVDKFDYKKGYKFSTYATWWIRQAITMALAKTLTDDYGITIEMAENINKFQQVERRLVQDLGREPISEEIAAEMSQDLDKVNHIIELCQVDNSDRNILYSKNTLENEADLLLLKKDVQDIISELTPREKMLIEMRFGLNGDTSHTLGAIGNKFGVSHERIRQIEAIALCKLEKIKGIEKLLCHTNFYDDV